MLLSRTMEKTIVTGGAGFIGSHTCVELVRAGLAPIMVDDLRNSDERVLAGLEAITGAALPLHRIDCGDREALDAVFAAEKPTRVIHFAADKAVGESVRDPLKYYRNNIGSLTTLLQVMANHGVKDLVFSSSCTVYGESQDLPITEGSPTGEAASPYGYTKVVCERILQDVAAADPALRVVMLRYFNPVGAHPSSLIGELPLGVPNNLVPFVTQTAAGLRDKLTVFGDDYDTPDGSCIRDYIHVVDLANAHVKALGYLEKQNENVFYDIFNVGTGQGNSVLELIRTFEKVTGEKLSYEIGPRRQGDVEKVYANVDKANQKLDWHVQYSLEDSLRDSWNWQKKLGDA